MMAPGELAIYLHWPFCQSKCPYCDFNSYASETIDHGRWRRAYLSELDRLAAELPDRVVGSVFFGGGTPSLMEPASIEAIVTRISDLWATNDNMEVSAEANPSSAEAGLFQDFRTAGINRLSLGVQSLNDKSLRFLGRLHNASEAREAVSLAEAAMERTSIDLIYALPGQTLAEWRDELGQALSLAGEHISAYQLSIEPGTGFATQGMSPAEAEEAAALFKLTGDMLAKAGLPAYEISNHARPGGECRHNLTYWRGGDWGGIGPGAHSRLTHNGTRWAGRQIPSPQDWLVAVENKGSGEAENLSLNAQEWRDELFLMGLRLNQGISRSDFKVASLPPENLEPLLAAGFLQLDDQGLRATQAGLLRLDSVLSRLLS